MDVNPALERSCGRPINEMQVALRPLPGQSAEEGELRVQCGMTSRD